VVSQVQFRLYTAKPSEFVVLDYTTQLCGFHFGFGLGWIGVQIQSEPAQVQHDEAEFGRLLSRKLPRFLRNENLNIPTIDRDVIVNVTGFFRQT